MNQHSYTMFIIIALILLSIYRRVRRNIGWQQLNQGNLRFRSVLFLIVGLIFLSVGVFHPISLISDIVGILIGIILAYYGSNSTSIESRDGHLRYRPNTWIGSIVTVIFLARFFYRFYGIFTSGVIGSVQQGQTSSLQNLSNTVGNSWTAGLMLIMFAYYAVYNTIILRKQKQFLQTEKKITD